MNPSDNIVETVKDIASEVYESLGCGRLESVYEKAMSIEFRLRDISYEEQRSTEIVYKNHSVGTAILDFIVERTLVVELKATQSISKKDISQAKAYARETGIDRVLVITFPYPKQNLKFEEFDLRPRPARTQSTKNNKPLNAARH